MAGAVSFPPSSVRLWIIACAAACAAASPSSAADVPESAFLETATVYARPLATATSAVTVVSRDEIQALGATSVAEILEFVPGVFVVSSGARGGVSYAQIRGGDPNFTVVMIDGVPLNDVTDQFGGQVDLGGIPAAHVERIEVVRGPVSSSLGSAGLSGVINVITRRGMTDSPEFELDLAAGDSSLLEGAASISRGNEQRDYFVGLTWQQEQERIARDDFERLGLQINYRVRGAEGSALQVHGRVNSRDVVDYPESSGGPVLGDGATRSTQQDEVALGLDWTGGPRDNPQRVYLTAYRQDRDVRTPEIDPFQAPGSTEQTRYSDFQLGWGWAALNNGALRLNVGAEVQKEKGDNDATRFGFGGPTDVSFSLDRAVGAAFVEILAEPGDWTLELAARADLPESFDAELSPRLGWAYRWAGGKTRLRGSLGRSFKLPSFFALGDVQVGNSELAPEVSTGGDLGIEYSAAGFTGGLSVFEYRYDDLIDFDATTFALINREKVRSRGVEVGASWNHGESLRVQIDVTRQDVEDRTTTQTLVHRPELAGGLRIDWHLNDRWRWEIDGRWVSDSLDFQIPAARTRTAGYQLYGSALRFRPDPRWELHARVDNLADNDFETLIGFPGPGRAYRVGLRITPGPGR